MKQTYTTPEQDYKQIGLSDDDPCWGVAITHAISSTTDYDPDYIAAALNDREGKRKASPVAALWGFLIWEALRTLKLRPQGIDKLVEYFEKVIEYERVLYGVGPEWYRAHHAKHIFAVFRHGWCLLNDDAFRAQLNLFNRDFADYYGAEQAHTQHIITTGLALVEVDFSSATHFPKQQLFEVPQPTKPLLALWTIAALCHDLGLPMEKTLAINNHARGIFEAYGGVELSDLRYRSRFAQEELFISMLSALGQVVHKVEKPGKEPVAVFRTQRVMLAKRMAALIEMDHGIASALLVWKTLDGVNDVLAAAGGSYALDAEGCRYFIMIREAIAAIADHSNKHIYSRHCNLAFLLRICDEASEVYRPRAGDVFAGIPHGKPKVPFEAATENITFTNVPQPTVTVTYEFIRPSVEFKKAFKESQADKHLTLKTKLIVPETLRRENPGVSTKEWVFKETCTSAPDFNTDPAPKWKDLIFKLETPNA